MMVDPLLPAGMKIMKSWLFHRKVSRSTAESLYVPLLRRNPVLEKYLFCITDGEAGEGQHGRFNTYILVSDKITGPWKLVVYMERFGQQGYFVNIPSRFISKDGRTAWLCYAANYSGNTNPDIKQNPPASRYAMNLHEFQLKTRE